MEEVIGIRPSRGSLAEYGITYKQVDLTDEGYFDYDKIKSAIKQILCAKIGISAIIELINPIKETISRRAMTIQREVEIVPAQLGNTAGVIGASLLINS